MPRPTESVALDATDRRIVNALQGGLPVCERPYAEAAAGLGLAEEDLLARLQRLLADGALTRFGPMYHAERLGGGLTLAAMQIPPADFERVAAIVNAFPEVAHNYEREHALNMWFVLATETPERIDHVIAAIERDTGYTVYNMPKREEFFVGLRFEA
ncbi:MAG TPA: AsnC family transcriptional regulator [Burkholderiales bacterium]|nr:AsnC family transcriptional regulator [Burkholderiales bacterium]